MNSNANYNREKAKEYIDKYWKNYNQSYPSFHKGGGDCTNFVSQILHAGGMAFTDDGIADRYTWYTNWYCKSGATNVDGDTRVSLSWKVAVAFKNHWMKKSAKAYMLSYLRAIESMEGLVDDLYIGDIVQFCYSNGTPWHSLGITGYSIDSLSKKRDIILASHTKNSNTRSLLKTLYKYPMDYKLRVYKIKNGP